MTVNIFEHTAGCSPLSPCKSCQAVQFLRERLKKEQFECFLKVLEIDAPAKDAPVGLMTPVDKLELSVRAENVLRNENIRTIGELTSFSRAALLISTGDGAPISVPLSPWVERAKPTRSKTWWS